MWDTLWKTLLLANANAKFRLVMCGNIALDFFF